MSEDRAARFKELLDQAAIEYRCKPSDMAAQLSATRRLCIESYQEKLIAGRDVDVSLLRQMLEEETRCLPPPEPLKVTVEIVGAGGVPIDQLPRELDPTPPSGAPPDGGGGPAPTEAPPAAAALPAPSAPSNVVPLRGKAGGSINDPCPLTGALPPLKKYQPQYPGGYDTVPDWDAKHALPTPNYRGVIW